MWETAVVQQGGPWLGVRMLASTELPSCHGSQRSPKPWAHVLPKRAISRVLNRPTRPRTVFFKLSMHLLHPLIQVNREDTEVGGGGSPPFPLPAMHLPRWFYVFWATARLIHSVWAHLSQISPLVAHVSSGASSPSWDSTCNSIFSYPFYSLMKLLFFMLPF